jgi:hypothetical protein
VVVHVRLPSVLLLRVLVRDVHVIDGRMVVVVTVRRQKVTPVLATVQVVGDVIVLVPVLHSIVLVVTLRPRHRAPTSHLTPSGSHGRCHKHDIMRSFIEEEIAGSSGGGSTTGWDEVRTGLSMRLPIAGGPIGTVEVPG